MNALTRLAHDARSQVACHFAATLLLVMCSGCVNPEYNWRPPDNEAQILTNVVQLTRGSEFEKAGEAYFSPDMKWIIFQAVPRGEQQFQMYLAPVRYETVQVRAASQSIFGSEPAVNEEMPAGIGRPIRISPPNSRNTCGFFSPDNNSLIFASTAGKEDPSEPTSGYQRGGHEYRWSYPAGMEIFRADGWQGAISAVEPGTIVDLAKHPLTNNTAYDAECAFSPDGKWIIFTSNRRFDANRGEATFIDPPGSASSPSAKPPATSAPAGDLDLYAMRPDGSGVVQLTHTFGYDGGPFVSPDGKRLVYRSDRKNNNLLQIFTSDLVFDASGNITGLANEHQLTHDQNVNWAPFWFPDGEHLIYTTSAHGHQNYELYLMRADGSHKTRITFTPGADVLPAFSPDGRLLLWTSKRSDDGTTQVFVARFHLPRGA